MTATSNEKTEFAAHPKWFGCATDFMASTLWCCYTDSILYGCNIRFRSTFLPDSEPEPDTRYIPTVHRGITWLTEVIWSDMKSKMKDLNVC